MARLPVPGQDSGTWGDILNDYLTQSHKNDGTLKDNSVTANTIAPNSVTNASIAADAVNTTSIADGSITEVLLASAVQTKLNANSGAPDWSAITNKPAVIAAGADQAAARTAIGAGTSNLVIGTTSTTAKAGDYAPTKSDVGLANVDNTSDANKPISAATQTALDGKATTVHTHTASQISDATATGRSLLTATDATTARIAIDAGIAQRDRYGALMVVDGDSITIRPGTSSTWNNSPGGWSMEMARLSNGRIDLVYNAGVPSTGISTRLSNFASKVAAYSPQTVLLSNGTNDVSTMQLSDYLTSLTSYYDLVRGIGAQLILGGIYPKNVDVDKISTWNAALVEWAKPRGVLVIPFWELGDPATGAWPSGWSTDGVHPDYDSPAFPAIGKLAWQTVSRALTEPVAATARYAGDPDALMTNFFTDLTSTMTGTTTITAITATTGTLAAGDYQYRVVAANHYGNSPTYNDNSITLGATGGVQLTLSGAGSYTVRRVYRKGPGDSTFYYIGKVTTAGSGQTFTDDGSLTTGYAWYGGDSSQYPNGMITGGWQDVQTLAYGPVIRSGEAEGIRGNIFRGARCEGSAVYRSDRFLLTGLAEGQTITISVKCRGVNTAGQDALHLRFFNPAGSTQIDDVALSSARFGTDWGLIFGRAIVPTGSDRVYVCLEGSANTPWNDWAELRVY